MKLLPLLLVVPLLLAGCAQRSGEDIPNYNHLIHYETASLEGRIRIIDAMTDSAGDVLRAQVTVENPSAFNARYQYKFRWFDAQGMEVGMESEPWKPAELPARNQARYRASLPTRQWYALNCAFATDHHTGR